ncbi:MAG: hypothetical protein IKN29_05815 [Bacteroidales bacterium]|nr:hypothetical protein [Bacteroidales bacterium]
MLKQIKKLTALLFVAATMFTASSCSKDDGYSESDIIGVWYFPTTIGYDQMRGAKVDIKADHTVRVSASAGSMTFDWTFKDNQFTATKTSGQYTGVLSFNVKEVTSDYMTEEGDYRMNGNVLGSVSGTMRHQL